MGFESVPWINLGQRQPPDIELDGSGGAGRLLADPCLATVGLASSRILDPRMSSMRSPPFNTFGLLSTGANNNNVFGKPMRSQGCVIFFPGPKVVIGFGADAAGDLGGLGAGLCFLVMIQ